MYIFIVLTARFTIIFTKEVDILSSYSKQLKYHQSLHVKVPLLFMKVAKTSQCHGGENDNQDTVFILIGYIEMPNKPF